MIMAVSKPNAISLFDNIKKDYTPAEDQKNVKKAAPAKKPAGVQKAAAKPAQKKEPQAIKAPAPEPETATPETPAAAVTAPKRRGGGKSTPATFYMTPEILDMIKTASKAYGGNGSMYIRTLIAKDYMENGKTYESLPELIF